jgi:hypothetical protein
MRSAKETARLAGVLYVLLAITGSFSILYIPSRFIVPGDASATARKIVADESLFRIGILVDLISLILFILVAVTLYQLLKRVNERQALLMLILAVASVPVSFVILIMKAAPLVLLGGAPSVSGLATQDLEALAMVFLNLRGIGMNLVSVFWGLWLFPFGALVIQSGFIPKILGVLLMVAGAAYVTGCVLYLLLPERIPTVSRILMPLEAAELPVILWLLIKGVRGSEAPSRTLALGS